MIPLNISRDITGNPTTGTLTGLKPSDICYYFTLTQDTVKTMLVPGNAFPITSQSISSAPRTLCYFTFGGTGDVWVLPSSAPTLTLPSGTVTATTAILNPTAKELVAGQTLQFLTHGTDVVVGLQFYAMI